MLTDHARKTVRTEEARTAGLAVIDPGGDIVRISEINLLTGAYATGPSRFTSRYPRAQIAVPVRLQVITAHRGLKQIIEVEFHLCGGAESLSHISCYIESHPDTRNHVS